MTALFGGRPGVGGAPGARRAASTAVAVLVLVGRDEMVGGPAEQHHPPERALSTGVNGCQRVSTSVDIICVHRYRHVWTRTIRTRAPSQSIHRTLNPEDPEPESPEEAGRLREANPELCRPGGTELADAKPGAGDRRHLLVPRGRRRRRAAPTWSTRMWTCCCRKATGWRQCAHLHESRGAPTGLLADP